MDLNSFPQNGRVHPGDIADLQRVATSQILEEHLLESTGLYQLPAGRLARKLSAAGSAVPDLIRLSGSPLHSEANSAQGFVEFVGAGVLPAPWLALRSDSVTQLHRQISRAIRVKSSRTEIACERLKVLAAVGATLVKSEVRWRNFARATGADSLLSELPDGCVLICREMDTARFEAFSKMHDIMGIKTESLFHGGIDVLFSIRDAYGEGWLQGIRSFQAALEGVRKGTAKQPWVIVPELADAAQRASTSALELLAVGWIPVASPYETEGYSGIYLFRNVCLLDFWGGQLAIRDRRQRRLACAESFESQFPQDRVFLAFQGLNYTASVGREQQAPSKWFVFPELSFNAFNVVSRLLPGLRLTVVGYHAGSPRTSEAGVFERVLRFRKAKEDLDHRLSQGLITTFTEWLLEEKRPANKLNVPPLDICDVLEAAESNIQEERKLARIFGIPVDAPQNEFGALAGAFRFLWDLLLGSAERKDIPSIDRVTEEVLGVPSSVLEDLKQKMPEATPAAAYSALRESDRIVKKHFEEEGSNKKRNRQRYPIPKLIQQFLHMLAWTFVGILGVPMFLSEWLSKRTRFVAILPLDSPNGHTLATPTCRNRFVAGGWRSWQAYAHLFHPKAVEGSVCLDVSPLLEMASQSLRMSPCGWLANKCSETNELILSLMRRRRYVSNFDFGTLPRGPRPIRKLLDRLDGPLLVRCLQSVPGGRECMNKWVERMSADCQRVLDRASATATERPDDALGNYFSVFRDVEGIVAAALDAARSQPGPSIPRVYLELELLRTYFQAEVNARSNGREHKDAMAGGSPCGFAEDSIGVQEGGHIEEEILRLLRVPEIPTLTLVQAVKTWEETEAQRFGDTIEGLLADLDREIDERERRTLATGDEELRCSRMETIRTQRRNLRRLNEEIDCGF